MARPQFIQAQPAQLEVTISDSENSEIIISELVDLYGNDIQNSDIGDKIYFTFAPRTDSEEIIEATGFTRNTDGTVSIDSGIVRGLKGVPDYTSGGDATEHQAGTQVIVSNPPHIHEQIMDYAESLAQSGAADADTTTKGIVEEATVSELNNDTDVGATGARLYGNPSRLASSKYGQRLPSSEEKTFLTQLLGGLTGTVFPYAGPSAPTGFKLCDGTLYNNNNEPSLHDAIVDYHGRDSGTNFTADDSTDQLNATSHGLSEDDRLTFSTDGTLPGGLSANTVYFVVNVVDSNNFQVSTTQGGAATDITSTGSGTHSFHTQFAVPDLVGRVPVGADSGNSRLGADGTVGNSAQLGDTGGSEVHVMTESEMPSHTHDWYEGSEGSPNDVSMIQDHASDDARTLMNEPDTDVIQPTGGDNPHQNMPPYQTVTYIIKD